MKVSILKIAALVMQAHTIHVLAIWKHTDKRWEDLNEEYRKKTYLALDTHFMDEHLFNSMAKLEEVQDDEFENIINVM